MLAATRITDRAEWDTTVEGLAGHPMQLWGWGEVKGAGAWTPVRVTVRRGAEVIGCAQVLLRPLPGGQLHLGYLPRGPQTLPGEELETLQAVATELRRTHRMVGLMTEPDWEVSSPAGITFLSGARAHGWRPSVNTVLIPTTLILDLSRPLDELFSEMKKKGRQYVRKGQKAGFEVRPVTDAAELGKAVDLYQATAQAADFGLHPRDYYLTMPQVMGSSCRVWGAYRDDELHAFLWNAVSGSTAFELYGGTSPVGQDEHATPMLKWAVISECAQAGVTRYDLNGLLNDGISQFKRQFAKHENLLVGTWVLPMSPLFRVFDQALPMAQKVLRRRG